MTLLLEAVRRRPDEHWWSLDEVPWWWGRSVVTLGVFDGLHRGHVRLLGRAVELGARRGLPVVLVTFDPHPATVTGPARDTTRVVTLGRRVELARQHGADAVLVLPFDESLARTTAVDFARNLLVRALRATDVVIGENFRFGHRGAGDVRLLRRLGERHGFTAHGVALLPGCSSTRVRALVAEGDLASAERILGRPHRVPVVTEGDRMTVPGGVVLPPDGRYRARVGLGVTEVEATEVEATDIEATDIEATEVELRGRTLVFPGRPGRVAVVDLLDRG